MTIERTPAPSEAVCTRCAGPVRPGARFCVVCGAPIAGGTPSAGFPAAAFPDAAVPAPRTPSPSTPFQASPGVPFGMPSSGPFGAPQGAPFQGSPSAPFGMPRSGSFGAPPVMSASPAMPAPADADARRASTVRIAVIVGALLVVVAAVVGAVVVARQSATPAAPAIQAAPTGQGTVVGTSSDPTAQLRAQQQADNGAAESAVGTWMPQLSAKKVGMLADGTRYDAAAILADHQRLRGQYPGAMLVWSGDYASFKGSDFWVTLAGQSFATPEQANSWCASAGFDADHCYAKRLSHSGGYAGNTVLRN